jgi:phospholipase/carboxylesterase
LKARPLSVVALHGLAESTEEIDRMATRVSKAMACPDVEWLFPRAPRRPVTILEGRPAHAWYDVLAYDRTEMDVQGLDEATDAIAIVVARERRRGRRVALVGFSQGGALALHAGLGLGSKVEDIVAIAAALPAPERVASAPRRAPRLFLGHGRLDRLVPHALGHDSWRRLVALGYDAEWHSYWCGHVVCTRLLRDVRAWLGHDRTPAVDRAKAAAGRLGLSALPAPE